MKIQKIQIQNLKAVDEAQLDLEGCSAIVFGGNGQGKTTILSNLIERLRGEKPEIIVKEGQNKGYYIMDLTDGSQIQWYFTEKSEKFHFITKDGVKQTTGVIKAIRDKYFGSKFDINKFIYSSPKDQVKQLERLAGIDFSDINERYQKAYEARRDAKKKFEWQEGQDKKEPEPIEEPDVEVAKKFVQDEKEKRTKRKNIEEWYDALTEFEGGPFEACIDFEKAKDIVEQVEDSEWTDQQLDNYLQRTYQEESEYRSYIEKQREYEQWQADLKKAEKEVEKKEEELSSIEEQRKDMLKNANLPEGFNIDGEQVFYKGYPLSFNQLSSSAMYIAALKLGHLVIGDVRSMHFDASKLDKYSLEEIQNWAHEQNLQLLIERPEFEGGEVKYEIIQEE